MRTGQWTLNYCFNSTKIVIRWDVDMWSHLSPDVLVVRTAGVLSNIRDILVMKLSLLN